LAEIRKGKKFFMMNMNSGSSPLEFDLIMLRRWAGHWFGSHAMRAEESWAGKATRLARNKERKPKRVVPLGRIGPRWF
jgi:hypothetical protein